MNFLVRLFSNEGTPANYRSIDGFAINTYVWTNSDGEQFFVRYKFLSE